MSDSSSSGGLLTAVAFTRDGAGSFLLACSGCSVKVYSSTTGAEVRVLSGHTAEVTAVAQSPTSVLQAISAGLDGRIILWDLDEGIALRTICVGLPIVSMVLDTVQRDCAYVLTGEGGGSSDSTSGGDGAGNGEGVDPTGSDGVPAYCRGIAASGRVYSLPLRVTQAQADWAAQQQKQAAPPSGGDSSGSAAAGGFGTLLRPWPAELTKLFSAKGGTCLACSSCGGASAIVGALAGKLLKLHDVGSKRTIDCNQRQRMSCLALSPTEPLAATGDDKGRIILWYVDGEGGGEGDAEGDAERSERGEGGGRCGLGAEGSPSASVAL